MTVFIILMRFDLNLWMKAFYAPQRHTNAKIGRIFHRLIIVCIGAGNNAFFDHERNMRILFKGYIPTPWIALNSWRVNCVLLQPGFN